MWQGREALPPGFTLLVSSAAHLSVLKNAHILGIPFARIHVVPARPDGAIDADAFGAALAGCSSALVVRAPAGRRAGGRAGPPSCRACFWTVV
jgi:glutamate/tyrosine decarboxylase-like PLP-dependent enzyme